MARVVVGVNVDVSVASRVMVMVVASWVCVVGDNVSGVDRRGVVAMGVFEFIEILIALGSSVVPDFALGIYTPHVLVSWSTNGNMAEFPLELFPIVDISVPIPNIIIRICSNNSVFIIN